MLVIMGAFWSRGCSWGSRSYLSVRSLDAAVCVLIMSFVEHKRDPSDAWIRLDFGSDTDTSLLHFHTPAENTHKHHQLLSLPSSKLWSLLFFVHSKTLQALICCEQLFSYLSLWYNGSVFFSPLSAGLGWLGAWADVPNMILTAGWTQERRVVETVKRRLCERLPFIHAPSRRWIFVFVWLSTVNASWHGASMLKSVISNINTYHPIRLNGGDVSCWARLQPLTLTLFPLLMSLSLL